MFSSHLLRRSLILSSLFSFTLTSFATPSLRDYNESNNRPSSWMSQPFNVDTLEANHSGSYMSALGRVTSTVVDTFAKGMVKAYGLYTIAALPIVTALDNNLRANVAGAALMPLSEIDQLTRENCLRQVVDPRHCSELFGTPEAQYTTISARYAFLPQISYLEMVATTENIVRADRKSKRIMKTTKNKSFKSATKMENVRMGIELEFQEYRYVAPNNYQDRYDHTRIFDSAIKINTIPEWFLEVDGTGNIEFVSYHFDVLKEADRLINSVKEMCLLTETINNIAKKTTNKFSINLSTFNQKNSSINVIGQFVHYNPNFKEKVIDTSLAIQLPESKKPLVYPQATFQLPLEATVYFINYMSKDHPALTKGYDSVPKDFHTTDLVSGNEKARGLFLLASVNANLLTERTGSKEEGPKSYLALMSRGSFSEMYNGLSSDEQLTFFKLVKESDMNWLEKPLFKEAYPIFFGVNIFTHQPIEKYVKSMREILTKDITVKTFFDSIMNAVEYNKLKYEYNMVFCRSLDNILKNKFSIQMEETDNHTKEHALYKNKNLFLKKEINFSAIDTIQKDCQSIFDMVALTPKDIISPPPFMDLSYAMGKYSDIPKGMAIIEMRGYKFKYGTEIEMGDSILKWLKKELEMAHNFWTLEK